MADHHHKEADLLELIDEQIELMRRLARDPACRPRARWLLKEAIFWIWERPRLREPRLGKYSLHLPWSPRAYERLVGWSPGDKRPSDENLRFEHLIPRGILAEALLNETPPDLADFLNRYFRAAVVTVEDDRQLSAAGVRSKPPLGWTLGDDPWDRYRFAQLDPDAFVVPVDRLAEVSGG